MVETIAPFRADHVGSLLRPPELLRAREEHQQGTLSAESLREIEDRCIRAVAKLQEEIGLQGITDGEYRRTIWHADFLRQIEGVSVKEGVAASGGVARKFQSGGQEIERSPTRFCTTGRLKRSRGIETDNFKYLAAVTSRTPKLCIPSPTILHMRGGRDAVDKKAYPDMDRFYSDLAQVYREEIRALAELGCTYLQLDDPNLAYLCDEKMRESVRQIGEDPNQLPRTYAKLINDCIKDRPANMTVCMHICRGNFRSAWAAEGGYDPVAEILFNEFKLDGFFLEYDSPRAGSFSPLRFVPKDKKIVLGLVTTKTGEMETADKIEQRIDEAARYVPLEQLALSPQCGFSSTVLGNNITVDAEIAKLSLVVAVARKVWG
ncbi:MAG: 5-methyltetrahydropteroyltriglutamate--homocysteine methyltransferase [Candidatus Binatota bacterium]|jgi:5-methyltetrahydropteroyltriglutamate--homocysteine methyltransferase|nr:5-methyltetrahydropteroyltriglutamate--homocysteine methyltransferase [Candidatus Binatota bacterium]